MGARIAVVTGANRGIGRAIAVALAADGFTVVATARDTAKLDDTVDEITAAGRAVVPVACDITDEDALAALAERVQQLGRVHTVVANAGIACVVRKQAAARGISEAAASVTGEDMNVTAGVVMH